MSSEDRILDVAERRMRQQGYNAVSYRDIAADVGMKSASLHYHFPKKADLGAALVRRYSEAFKSRVASQTSDRENPSAKLAAFVDVYRHALEEQRLLCLCAVLGAEVQSLPPAVAEEVKKFFDENIAWLTDCYESMDVFAPEARAKTTLAVLEGAMIMSSVSADNSAFNAAAESIAASR